MSRILLVFVFSVCVFFFARAMATPFHGYRVIRSDQTLIQIARDLYDDERLWKDIAQWNNLKPPYSLHAGDVLILMQKPRRPIVKAHQVSEHEIPDLVPYAQWPSVARRLENENGQTYYTVSERAPSLYMVARDLYGDTRMAKDIAQWNQLQRNASLQLGQKLVLKKAPALTEHQGTAILINKWRELGNQRMVARLSATTQSKVPSLPIPAKIQPQRPTKTSQVVPRAQPETASHAQPGVASHASMTFAPSNIPLNPARMPSHQHGLTEDTGEPRDESYWLGDYAEELIQKISEKLDWAKPLNKTDHSIGK